MGVHDFRAIPPQLAPLSGAELPLVHSFDLANGIRVVAFDGATQPVNMVSLVREGGNADIVSPAILPMMLATIGEGTGSRTGAEIAGSFDSNGSWLRTGAYGHHSVVTLLSLNSCVENVLPVFVDMLENASFPERELEAKKTQIAQQIGVQMQKVSVLADAAMRKQLCGVSHPLALLNTPQQVMQLNRNDMVKLFSRVRQPRLSYLFLGGALTPKVMDAVCASAERLTPSGAEPVKRNVMPFAPSAPNVEKIIVKDALQSAVCIGIPAISRNHPDYSALHLVVTALGGYFGSRLMMNLREDKGYTYGVNASLLGVHEGAWVKIAFECSHDYVESAIEQVRIELERLVTDPPAGEELERLRRFALISHLETLDSPLEIVSYYRNMVLSDIPENYFSVKQRVILSISPNDISHIAATYLRPENLRIAVAGQ